MTVFRSLAKCCFQRQSYRQLSNKKQFKEVAIPVPWGYIRGKWWGPTDKRPILTLHGSQDNCGSFDRLIPLLNTDTGYLAIDLSGHGYSSRLPTGVPYDITTYLSAIHYTKKHLGWSRLTLMVHTDVAHYLLERGISPSKTQPGKYYFTRDPRLKAEPFT
ncbi:probable serine hydrolase [Sitophilus oryzae]|uniref:Probable serine hydrolase n=1 Tax=Sitophilus oryzae TaxID=7048 RepID=A0A6J2XS41_SITOR|nr:probable serine hydrolase [Sitophilus oryzae]